MIDIQVSWLNVIPKNSLGQREDASTTTPQLPGTFHALLTSFTQQSFQVEIIIPFLQMRKLRLREVTNLPEVTQQHPQIKTLSK